MADVSPDDTWFESSTGDDSSQGTATDSTEEDLSDNVVHRACRRGVSLPRIQALMSARDNAARVRDKMSGAIPLYWAALGGHEAVVAMLITRKRSDVNNQAWKHGRTPLFAASMRDHVVAARCLLAHGADVNLTDFGGVTPLIVACSRNHASVVGVLLTAPAVDVNRREPRRGYSPIHFAGLRGYNGVLRNLLRHRSIVVDLRSTLGETPLMLACRRGKEEAALELIDHGADVSLKDSSHGSPLADACKNGMTRVVEEILKHPFVDVNGRKCLDISPLTYALTYPGPAGLDMVRLLCRDPRLELDGREALVRACRENKPRVAAFLIDHNHSDVNAKDGYSITALHWASGSGHVDVVRTLLNHGADIGAVDYREGLTPLHMACQGGRVEAVRLLCTRGADPTRLNLRGQSPLQAMEEWVHSSPERETIRNILLEACSRDSAQAEGGSAPLSVPRGNPHPSGSKADTTRSTSTSEDSASTEPAVKFRKMADASKRSDMKRANAKRLSPTKKSKAKPRASVATVPGTVPAHTSSEEDRQSTSEEERRQSREDIQMSSEEEQQTVSVQRHPDNGEHPLGGGEAHHLSSEEEQQRAGEEHDMSSGEHPEGEDHPDIEVHPSSEERSLSMEEEHQPVGADGHLRSGGDDPGSKEERPTGSAEHSAGIAGLQSREEEPALTEISGPIYSDEDVATLLDICERFQNINFQDDSGNTPLHHACAVLDYNRARRCVELGADVHLKNKYGLTPLDMAHMRNRPDFMHVLIRARNFQPDRRSPHFHTVLTWACKEGHVGLVEQLVRHEHINLDLRDRRDFTALRWACLYGHETVVRILLSFGADVNARDSESRMSPFHCAVWLGHGQIVTMMLREETLDVNVRDLRQFTPLMTACHLGYGSFVSSILKFDLSTPADVNASTCKGVTALHLACFNDQLGIIKELLMQRGICVNKATGKGRTAVTILMENIKRLKENPQLPGFDEDPEDLRKEIKFRLRWMFGAVMCLLENGADANSTIDGGVSLLHLICGEDNQLAYIEIAVGLGADMNAKDSLGRTPIQLAEEQGRLQYVEFLQTVVEA